MRKTAKSENTKKPVLRKCRFFLTFVSNKLLPSAFLTCSIAAPVAQAAPQGGNVVAGEGHISRGSITTVRQYTDAMVVDWSSFNVSRNESVNFKQPSSSSSALNRIYDQNPSQIFGSINANGRVFLTNPNGVIFTPSSTVNVGALFATSLGISNRDFMAGRYNFSADGYTPGAIINRGELIAADNGSISLVGGRVENTGVIAARYGRINLASGTQAYVSFDQTGMIGFQVSGEVLENIDVAESAVSNSGTLSADGGTVLLDAHAARDVFDYAVNNEGMISARSLQGEGGDVYLLGNNGTTIHAGEIDAYGENSEGGSVFMLGEHVGVFESGTIDASGDNGGGTVLIGGDWQGSGDKQTASRTYVSDEAVIRADAVQSGNGGKVVVWADEITRYQGSISATGGEQSGDGGQVEVSGKQYLAFNGEVDVSAAQGEGGTVLLDPQDIVLDGAGTDVPADQAAGTPDREFDDPDTSTNHAINVASVTGYSELYLQANRDITVSNALTMGSGNSVVLEAGRDIDVNAAVTVTNGGDITLIADADFSAGGGSAPNADGDLTIGTSGSLSSGSGTTDGDIFLSAEDIIINNTATTVIDAGSGDVTITTTRASSTIDIGGTTGSGMDISTAELGKINGANLTIGDNSHTGTISTVNTVSLSVFDSISVRNNGNISLGDPLTNSKANGVINVDADAGSDGGTGAITAAAGATLTATTVNLKAASGMGTSGNNILTAASNISFDNTTSGSVFINNTGALDITSGANTARSVSVESSSTLSQSGAIDVGDLTTESTGNTTLTNSSNTIASIDATTNTSGNISITDSADGLGVASISSAGNASLTTTGDLTQSGTITATNLVTTSNDGATTLALANEVVNYTGTTTTSAAGDHNIQFNDNSGGLVVAGISTAGAGDTTISTTGALTQSGVITTDVLSTSSTGADTTLTSANVVNGYNGTTVTSGNISFTDNAGGLDITGISSAGNTTLATTGNLTQSGAINTSLLTTTSTTGSTNLANTSNTIASVDATSTGGTNAVTIFDSAGGLDIVAIDSAGDVTVTTTGDLSQTGAIDADLLTTTSTTGTTTLDNTSNTIGSLDATSTGGGKNITVFDSADGLDIVAISSVGDVTITTTGNLTQSGAISAALLTTTSTSGATTLLNSSNTISSIDATSTGGSNAISILDSASGLAIAGINSAGNATITTTGDLTQSGTITAATLATTSNDGATTLGLANEVTSFDGTTTTSLAGNHNIQFNDNSGGLVVAGITTAGTGDTNISTTGALVQSGTITTDVLTTSSTGADTTLTLANEVNSYNGTTTTSGNISLNDNSGGLVITGVSSAGNTTISTTGDLTQSGAISTALLTTTSNSGSTTLANAGNTISSFDGTTNTSGDITLVDASGGLSLANVSAIGNVDITANSGDITIDGAVGTGTSTTASIAATAGAIDGDGTNTVTATSVNLTAANGIGHTTAVDAVTSNLGFNNTTSNTVAIDNTGNLSITSGSNTGRAVSISSTGTIDQAGATGGIDAGALTTSSTGSTTLDNTANTITSYDGTTNTSGDITLVDASGGLSLTGISALGSADITATTGNITIDGAVGAGTTATIQATAGAIDGDGTNVITANTLNLTALNGIGNSTTVDSQASLIVFNNTNNAVDISNTRAAGVTVRGVNTGTSTSVAETSGTMTVLSTTGINTTGASGDVTLTADDLDIQGAILAAGRNVSLQTANAGRQIDFGASDGAVSGLELSSTEVNLVTADGLQIGNTGSGLISISDAMATTGITSDLVFVSSAGVSDTASGALTGNKNVGIDAAGAVVLDNTANDINTIAIDAGAANDVTYVDSGVSSALSIGDVGTVSGITGNNINITAAANDINVSSAVSAGGSVDVTAQGAGSTITVSSTITGTSGDHVYTSDKINLDTATIDAGTNRVTLRPLTASTQIDLGAADDTNFGLSNTEVNNITADTLEIGRSSAGQIKTNADITPGSISTLRLISGGFGGLGVDGAGGINGGIDLAIETAGDVNFGASDVNNLAISNAGFDIDFEDTNSVTIGSVDGIDGITAANLSLKSSGAITLDNDINVTGTTYLVAGTGAGGLISGAGSVTSANLGLEADSVSLSSTSNNVDILAGDVDNDFTFTDSDGFTVGSVTDGSNTSTGVTAATLDLTNISGVLTIDNDIVVSGATPGNATITTDDIAINSFIDWDGQDLTISTFTAGLDIDLGVADTAVTALKIDAAELTNILADNLTIGDAATGGDINVTQDVATSVFVNTLTLASSANITADNGGIQTDSLALSAGGDVSFTDTNTQVENLAAAVTGAFTFVNTSDPGADLNIDTVNGITGIAAGSLNLTETQTDIFINEAISTTDVGGITISSVGGVQISAPLSAAGSGNIDISGLTFVAQDGAIASSITTDTGDIILASSTDIAIKDDIISTGGGNLILKQLDDNVSMGIGTGTAGTINLDDSELAFIQPGFSSVTFGDSSDTVRGNIDVNLDVDVAFNTNTIIYGDDIQVDNITAAGDVVTLNARGVITGSGSSADITANEVNLNATNTDGLTEAIGSSVTALTIDSTTASINADATSGRIYLSGAGDMNLGSITGSGLVSIIAGTGGTGGIIDANGNTSNINSARASLEAVDGIGSTDSLEIDVNSLSVNNTGVGNIDITDSDNVTLTGISNNDGDIDIVANDSINIDSGLIATVTTGGTLSLLAGIGITTDGAFTVNSAGGFVYNQTMAAAGAVSITTVDQLNITENITTSAGDITLDSSAIVFSSGVEFDAAGSINIQNAAATGNGDLTFRANGIDLSNALTVNNGNLILDAGNDDLSVNDVLTVDGGNLDVIASDFEITPTGSIVGSNRVTIADNGNGMELGGTPDPAKLNISLVEYDLITAGSLELQTSNGLTLNESFVATDSTAPLTINANEMTVAQVGTTLGVNGNLDLADTAVTAVGDFTIDAGGSFDMNNTITTNGVFELTAANDITMTEPTSITSNNNDITMTSRRGDVLLGLVDAGTGDITINSNSGSILNNNGVFTDVTLSQINLQATNVSLNANQRIGASSTDAITINASPAGTITLDFDADNAFINNLQNTRIVNNGSGDVAVGLIFSSQIIGIGHNVGILSQETEEPPETRDTDKSMMSVIGSDYKLTEVEEEEEDSSTINTVVPVMIRTKEGWEFKAPSNPEGGEKKVHWL